MMVGVVKVIDVVMELFDVARVGVVVAKVAVYLFFFEKAKVLNSFHFSFLFICCCCGRSDCSNSVPETKVIGVVKVIDVVRVDEVRRRRKRGGRRRGGDAACLAGGCSGGSDTAVRFALEDILRPLLNNPEGKRAASGVVRRREPGEEACVVDVSVPLAPGAEFLRRGVHRQRRGWLGAVEAAAETPRSSSYFVDLKGVPGSVAGIVNDVVFYDVANIA